MTNASYPVPTDRYAKCIEVSRRIRWDIDKDVFRGRTFDFTRKFLPDGLSQVNQLRFLGADEQRLLSQVQGRSYAYIFGLVERFINAKVLEVSRDHWFENQTALQALVRFSDEEIKHQEMFRRIEDMIAQGMPAGYVQVADPNDVARLVLGKSTWAVLALTCHIELFTQLHYRESIQPDENLSELFKDVFLYHWREESQHAILDELEWEREDACLSEDEREQAVTDLIELVGAVDGLLQAQSTADADYFLAIAGREFSSAECERIRAGVLAAYRWQYIVSGVQHPHFQKVLGGMITAAQGERIQAALAPLFPTH